MQVRPSGPRAGLVALCLLVPNIVLVAGTKPASHATWATEPTATPQQSVAPSPETLDALPMAFEPNVGQVDPRAKFVARGGGYTVFLGESGVVLSLATRRAAGPAGTGAKRGSVETRQASLALGFEGGSAQTRLVASDPLSHKSNYFRGNNPKSWHTDIPTYGSVRYEEVYPGVDVVFRGTQGQLSYTFDLAPGADASAIRFKIDGADELRTAENGDLVVRIGDRELTQRAPEVRQRSASGEERVAGRYVVSGGVVGVRVASAVTSGKALSVSPTLVFATFLGGDVGVRAGDDTGNDVAVDSAGNVYVVGSSLATDLPTTSGAAQIVPGGDGDAFVAKLNPQGTGLVYSTFLGGKGLDEANSVAVGADGSVFVGGRTLAIDFPATPGAARTANVGATDGFVAKLNPQGTGLVYATYLGGASYDHVNAIALDPSGNAYATGQQLAGGFPTTPGAFDTTESEGGGTFVTKINAAGTGFVYSTLLEGAGYTVGNAIAVSPNGVAYVTGSTEGAFPTTPGAFDATPNGASDAFVTKVNAAGSALVYSTLVGGGGIDVAEAIALTQGGAVVITGRTDTQGSATPFPTTTGALDRTPGFSNDVFVAKINPAGSALSFSTFVAGDGYDVATDLAVDASGAIYVVGTTGYVDPGFAPFPTTPGAFLSEPRDGSVDAFVIKLDGAGASLLYSTLVGGSFDDTATGIAVDGAGSAFLTGSATYYNSGDGRQPFPTTAGAFDATYNGGTDTFVTKLNSTGTALTFSTYVAGAFGQSNYDIAWGVATDATGSVYVAGWTGSQNFPTTPGAYDTHFDGGNSDVFVTKLAPNGTSLAYSTVIGGHDQGQTFNDYPGDYATGLAVDAAGSAYVVGSTSAFDFPTTSGAFDQSPNGHAAFLTKLAPAGNALVYSTVLDDANANGVAVDAAGAAYVTGVGYGAFPTTSGAYQTEPNGVNNAFVTKVAPSGSALAYSSYVGGDSYAEARSIAVDASGAAYITGVVYDAMSIPFPTTSGAFDTTDHAVGDGFVTKLTPDGSTLAYSTMLGGDGNDDLYDIAVGPDGTAYVTGWTDSLGAGIGVVFPTTPGAFQESSSGGLDAFVTRLNAAGSGLIYSTLLGGSSADLGRAIALDAAGAAYVVGDTQDTELTTPFPTTPNAYDRTVAWRDVFVSKLNPLGSVLEYSTLIGGSYIEFAGGIAIDAQDGVYVTGTTASFDFPATGGVQGRLRGNYDSFVAKFRIPARGADTPGIYVASSGAWFLRNANAGGSADVAFTFGAAGGGLVPLVGDWDGDGDDTPGLYVPATGAFFLRNSNSAGNADVVFTFGAGGGGLVPLSGDWNGDGTDTIGLYGPSTGVFFLRNANASGVADATFSFGGGGVGIEPLVGDWNGDGTDTIGLNVASTGTFFLRNSNTPGAADLAFSYGPAGATPITGDWNGDGLDTVGVYTSGDGAWFLRNTNTPGAAHLVFTFGPAGVTPLVGDWDGQ